MWETSTATLVISIEDHKFDTQRFEPFDPSGKLSPTWDQLHRGIKTQVEVPPQTQAAPPQLQYSQPVAPTRDDYGPAPLPAPEHVQIAYMQVREAVGRILTAALRHARANKQQEAYKLVESLIHKAMIQNLTWAHLVPHAKHMVQVTTGYDAKLTQYATILCWVVKLLSAMVNGEIAQSKFPEYAAAVEKGLTPLGVGTSEQLFTGVNSA